MDAANEIQLARKCLTEVRDLIKTDGKLCVPKDDIFLLRFVRAKKYNAALSYKNLLKYYEARRRYPKNFDYFYPTGLKHVLDSGVVSLLRNRDSMQRRTFVFRVGKWDPDILNFDEITMTCVLIAEQMSWCPINQCAGAVILVDESDLRLGHARQITLPAMYKMVQLLQDCFPGRYKAAHLVNQPYILDLVYNLAKRFLTKKLVSRIKVHSDFESLHDYISPDILPESMGGNLKEEEAFDTDMVSQMINIDNYYKVAEVWVQVAGPGLSGHEPELFDI